VKIYIDGDYQPESSLNASCFGGIEIVNRPILSAMDYSMVMCGGFTLVGLEIVPDGWHEPKGLPGVDLETLIETGMVQ
jgi:hypothetical protein